MGGKNATALVSADDRGIAQAAAILKRGGLVAVPTETVYGLAARADSADAVAAIYAAKGRPSINPLIVHVGSLEQARSLAEFSDMAEQVAAAAWPGALTMVLPRKADAQLAQAVSAGLPTIALRLPAHPVMRALIDACGVPLAAPSANRSEAISPTTPEHVLASLDGRIDMVLDAGSSEKGLESSILAIRHDGRWEELRPGPVDLDLLHQHFMDAPLPVRGAAKSIEAPGQMARHYSPGKPMRLDTRNARDDEFLIGFGDVSGHVSLSQSGNMGEAAARLYDCLHRAASADQPRIAVAPIPPEGVGRAINDRLRRAAS